MKIHSEFRPSAPRFSWITNALNGDAVWDGGFSRVYAHTPQTVIKATCCQATNLLLNELWRLTRQGKEVPHHLPAVSHSYGSVVTDTQNIKFCVWELERLFEANDSTGQRLARSLPRNKFVSAKPAYLRQLARLTPQGYADLHAALTQEQDYFGGEGGFTTSKNIALAMSLRTEGELRKTFLFLHDFVSRHQMGLDLLGTGNLLVNMFGEACLSDAVWDGVSDATFGVSSADTYQGTCIGVEVPVSIEGFTVKLEPRATLALSEQELLRTTEQCGELGLTATQFNWGSSAQSEFLNRTVAPSTVWVHPQASRFLKENRYAALFCA